LFGPFDPSPNNRACPGFTLFAPQSGSGKVYVIDMDGKVVHTWQMSYAPGNYGYLTERGTLFYNGKVVEDSNRFISRQPWRAAQRSKPTGTGGCCGRCGTPITITMVYGYAMATCCFSV
jgi:hypothetical protein